MKDSLKEKIDKENKEWNKDNLKRKKIKKCKTDRMKERGKRLKMDIRKVEGRERESMQDRLKSKNIKKEWDKEWIKWRKRE